MTVRENLGFVAIPIHRGGGRIRRNKVGEVAELLRISGKLENKATALSGGEMQQGVSIGRALVRSPAIYPLMDEPSVPSMQSCAPTYASNSKGIQANLGDDIPLCHPRPDRSHDDGDYRRARRRPPGTVRPAA